MTDVKKGRKKFGSTAITVLLVFVIVIAINIIATGLYFRLDVTEEKLYTLSEGTKNIVEKIKTPITIKYYFTKNLSELPVAYKSYGKKVGELLKEYQTINPDMITLETYNPKPDSDEEEWAMKYGLSGIDLGNGERAFLGLVVIQEDNEINYPFFDPRREQFLEYDVSQLLLQVYQKKEKTIGILSSLPVMGLTPNRMEQMQGQEGLPKWAFVEELEKTFKISEIEPTVADIADNISILIVIHPKDLSDATLYAIDQFVLRGGELIVLVDPNARVDRVAAQMAQMGQMVQTGSELKKLFKHWGIDYNANQILGDKDHATRVNAGGSNGVVSFSLWHTLTKKSFNTELIATKELENMLFVEPGGFTIKQKSPLKLNSLIKSSKNSGLVDSFILRFGDPNAINKKVVPDEKEYTMAGILTGELTSAFENRPIPPKSEDKNKAEEMPVSNKPHLAKSKDTVKILMITDADFVSDTFSVEKFNLMGQTMIQPKNDNLNFMVNMVEFIGGADSMMQIRSRGRFSRPFTRFLELQNMAQAKYQEAESALSAKLTEVQQKLDR
ncbi:GldG family protein, partial [bacterium]|nr:GldG family protein [bacterium]